MYYNKIMKTCGTTCKTNTILNSIAIGYRTLMMILHKRLPLIDCYSTILYRKSMKLSIQEEL